MTGQVSAIDGSKITLLLGTWTEGEAWVPQSADNSDQTLPEAPPDQPEDNNAFTERDGQTPPSKPDADISDKEQPGEIPSGNAPDGQKPDDQPSMPGSFEAGTESVRLDFTNAAVTKRGTRITVEEIAVGDVLTVTIGSDQAVRAVTVELQPDGQNLPGGGFGGSQEVTQGESANTITEDGTYDNVTYDSVGDDENALRVDGATVALDGVTVNKSAGATSNTENGDFYGMNAALLATNGATVTIKNATVTASAQNGNGVFSYGSGTTVDISASTITTTADNSGGIQTTGGGTTNAKNLTVETMGNSAAAIRSDRGGGTVQVEGGSYTSNGYNSPAVYSTAEITVRNAVLTANHSEALVIEGKNSITLENCTVTGNMSDTKGSSSEENVHNVMIYQSMSGDADVGTSTFSMTGGSLTSNNGDLFYVTNTHCILRLSGVTIANVDPDGCLLRVVGNSASHGWGTAGANGAQVELTADAQVLEGNIVVDTISTLNLTLQNGSVFTGSVNLIENAQNGEAVPDNAVITVGSGCVWNLTDDCMVTSLVNNGTIYFNGHTITLADGTVLQG